MTKKKKVILSVLSIIILTGIGIYTSVIKLPIVIKSGSPMYAFDVGNTDLLVANSTNVFVGKVIKKTGNKSITGSVPFTQFSVEVISNIKGDIGGVVTVNQIGGYRNGISKNNLCRYGNILDFMAYHI